MAVARGEYKSMRQAALAAGIVKPADAYMPDIRHEQAKDVMLRSQRLCALVEQAMPGVDQQDLARGFKDQAEKLRADTVRQDLGQKSTVNGYYFRSLVLGASGARLTGGEFDKTPQKNRAPGLP